ncbi:hypothetical protein K439DRAFT_1617886 [Ramaria rubella]|nr:hypothetical protein K439DRAFT_1617886 [Ramaria rubella]
MSRAATLTTTSNARQQLRKTDAQLQELHTTFKGLQNQSSGTVSTPDLKEPVEIFDRQMLDYRNRNITVLSSVHSRGPLASTLPHPYYSSQTPISPHPPPSHSLIPLPSTHPVVPQGGDWYQLPSVVGPVPYQPPIMAPATHVADYYERFMGQSSYASVAPQPDKQRNVSFGGIERAHVQER